MFYFVSSQEQTGLLLKKTGLSILLTSLSNMCAMFAAAIIPIPALRVFSLQSAVLVMFNLASTLLVFPAIVSLDLRRRTSGRYDLVCCYLPLVIDSQRTDLRKTHPSNCKLQSITRALPPDRLQTVTVLAPPKVKVISSFLHFFKFGEYISHLKPSRLKFNELTQYVIIFTGIHQST